MTAPQQPIIVDLFCTKAQACRSLVDLEELVIGAVFDTPADAKEAAKVYHAEYRRVVGDGETGEVLEELPEGF